MVFQKLSNNIISENSKNLEIICNEMKSLSKIAYEILTNLGYTVYDLGAFSSIDLPKVLIRD